jgi:DNA-binding Xre family transcriptional regulator
MLRFNFTRLFKARGIDKPYRYLLNAGYSSNYASRIGNNRIQRIDLQELEKFCELFQCTPNDLLQWFPDKDEITETHPLASLKRSDNVPYLTKLLYSVPLDKIAEIESMIKEKLKD